jgi:hypothetical protein
LSTRRTFPRKPQVGKARWRRAFYLGVLQSADGALRIARRR